MPFESCSARAVCAARGCTGAQESASCPQGSATQRPFLPFGGRALPCAPCVPPGPAAGSAGPCFLEALVLGVSATANEVPRNPTVACLDRALGAGGVVTTIPAAFLVA